MWPRLAALPLARLHSPCTHSPRLGSSSGQVSLASPGQWPGFAGLAALAWATAGLQLPCQGTSQASFASSRQRLGSTHHARAVVGLHSPLLDSGQSSLALPGQLQGFTCIGLPVISRALLHCDLPRLGSSTGSSQASLTLPLPWPDSTVLGQAAVRLQQPQWGRDKTSRA